MSYCIPTASSTLAITDNDLIWLGVIKLNPIVRLPEFLLGMGVGIAFLRLPTRVRTGLSFSARSVSCWGSYSIDTSRSP